MNSSFSCKRLIDVVAAVCGMAFLFPAFVAVACWIKLVSTGPVLFKQERVGIRGRRFIMLKFRTMDLHSETRSHENHMKELIDSDLPMQKLDTTGDPRIIRGGHLLRTSCLDELPQLINVIRGEMSLVGPRPCISSELESYSAQQKERFDAMPGLTGYWQVMGKNKTTFNEMVAMDIHYAKSKSLWLDLKIMLKTIPAIWEQVTAPVVAASAKENGQDRGHSTSLG